MRNFKRYAFGYATSNATLKREALILNGLLNFVASFADPFFTAFAKYFSNYRERLKERLEELKSNNVKRRLTGSANDCFTYRSFLSSATFSDSTFLFPCLPY